MIRVTRSSALSVLPAWATIAVLLVQFDAPSWVRLPVVGTFSLLGVGLTVTLILRITQLAIAISVTVAVGLSSLILASLVPLWLFRESAAGTLVIQAGAVWVLVVWALRDTLRSGAA